MCPWGKKEENNKTYQESRKWRGRKVNPLAHCSLCKRPKTAWLGWMTHLWADEKYYISPLCLIS